MSTWQTFRGTALRNKQIMGSSINKKLQYYLTIIPMRYYVGSETVYLKLFQIRSIKPCFVILL
jgi:hypothetical protein